MLSQFRQRFEARQWLYACCDCLHRRVRRRTNGRKCPFCVTQKGRVCLPGISQPSGVWRPPVFRHRRAAGGVSYAYSVRHAPAPVLFPARQGRKSDFRLRIALRICCAAATEASPTAPGNRRMPFRRALPACAAPSAVCGYGLRRRVLPFPALFSQRFCSRKCKKFEKRLTRR